MKGLAKRFGSAWAVDHIDLEIADGELVCLLGPSGCGKTTTLRLIAGFLDPDDGEIRTPDRVLSAPGRIVPPEQRRMSMIFQSYAVWPHMTVFENVAFGLTLRRLSKAEVTGRVAEVLSLVRLEGFGDRYPGQLSGGQQQRVALARALVVQPEILLLDEPLSNLDAKLRAEMRYEIRQLHKRLGFTTVYVTHDQSEAMVTADRVVVMNHGKIEQVGSPREVYERPASRFVAGFIGQTNLLSGRVEDRDTVVLAGHTLKVEPAVAHSPGAAVEVCIRPHAFRVAATGQGENGVNRLTGQVLDAVYLGATVECRVRLGDGSEVTALASPRSELKPADTVTLLVEPRDCVLLPAS